MNLYSQAVKPRNVNYGNGVVVEGQPPATSRTGKAGPPHQGSHGLMWETEARLLGKKPRKRDGGRKAGRMRMQAVAHIYWAYYTPGPWQLLRIY